jgi:5-methyltetrahydrofolate--homocysteine methyltransferase
VPFRQDTSFLSIGERTNANGSLAFKKAMLEERWDDCIEIARDQTRDGAHLLDVCIDYVGRDGVEDMKSIASRFATASTLPLVLDSTEPAVIEAGLELLGGRSVVNSVNYEDGDGPGRGSPGCCPSSRSTARPWSPCASTRTARRAPPSGRCASRPG